MGQDVYLYQDEKLISFFRCTYNPYSLAWFLKINIDEKAKADWGLYPFYDEEKSVFQGEDYIELVTKLSECIKEWKPKIEELDEAFVEDQNGNKKIISARELRMYKEWFSELVRFVSEANGIPFGKIEVSS